MANYPPELIERVRTAFDDSEDLVERMQEGLATAAENIRECYVDVLLDDFDPHAMLRLLDEGRTEETRTKLRELAVLYDLQREALACEVIPHQ